MIVTCKECKTGFNLDDGFIKQTGTKVRCSKCKTVFTVHPDNELDDVIEPVAEDFDIGIEFDDDEIEEETENKLELESDADTNDEFNLELEENKIETELSEQENSEQKDDELELELEDKENEVESVSEDINSDDIQLDDKKEDIEIEQDSGIELEFEIDDDERQDLLEEEITTTQIENEKEEKDEEEFTSEKFVMESSDDQDSNEFEEAEYIANKQSKHATKERISKALIVLLVIVLSAGGVFGALVLLNSMNVEIPFVSELFTSKHHDNGALKITTFDVDGKFISNTESGELFVITGKVKNEYSDALGHIKIKGKLYTKGKILAETKTVCCGKSLSELALSNMSIDAIDRKLSNCSDADKSKLTIAPDKELPFMIVFSNFPKELEEYTIEIANFSQLEAQK